MPAQAESLDADRARDLVERHRILTLQEILRRNEGSITGRIIEIELEESDGVIYYDFKVLTLDGHFKKLRIDAKTGALLGGK